MGGSQDRAPWRSCGSRPSRTWSEAAPGDRPASRRGRTALAGRSPNRLVLRSVPTTHALFARQVQREEQCRPVILNVGLPSTKAPPGASVQPKAVRRICGSSHAKSLWSRDVPERRGNLARFQRGLFKMTFASSNPGPTRARHQRGLAGSPGREFSRTLRRGSLYRPG